MVAVFSTKCQSGTALCDTIDFSDRRDLHSTLDPRNPLTHLKKKEVNNNLLTLFSNFRSLCKSVVGFNENYQSSSQT